MGSVLLEQKFDHLVGLNDNDRERLFLAVKNRHYLLLNNLEMLWNYIWLWYIQFATTVVNTTKQIASHWKSCNSVIDKKWLPCISHMISLFHPIQINKDFGKFPLSRSVSKYVSSHTSDLNLLLNLKWRNRLQPVKISRK